MSAEPTSSRGLLLVLEKRRNEWTSCLDLYGVTLLGSLLAESGLRQICVFDAADAESVRQANRGMGDAFERAWSSRSVPTSEATRR